MHRAKSAAPAAVCVFAGNFICVVLVFRLVLQIPLAASACGRRTVCPIGVDLFQRNSPLAHIGLCCPVRIGLLLWQPVAPKINCLHLRISTDFSPLCCYNKATAYPMRARFISHNLCPPAGGHFLYCIFSMGIL